MAIQWTGPMLTKCSEIYLSSGIAAAMKETGASYNAVKWQMHSLGVKCFNKSSDHLISKERRFYADDVALMFEMFNSGVKQKVIAEYFDTTIGSIKSVFNSARNNGFDAYPIRGGK